MGAAAVRDRTRVHGHLRHVLAVDLNSITGKQSRTGTAKRQRARTLHTQNVSINGKQNLS